MLNPALQELMNDVARIELTRRNATILEAEAAEERAQLLALRMAQPVTPAPAITEPVGGRVDPGTVSNQELRERFAKEQTKRPHVDSLPWKSDTDGAEAWTPRTVRRRG